MDILITVNTYYPLKDGVQSVTGYLAEGLAKKGHKVTVVTPNYGTVENETYNGVNIIRVQLYIKHTLYYGDKCGYVKKVKLLANKADVMINVCTQNPMTDLLFPILDDLKCKKILYMHGMYDPKWYLTTFKSIADIGHKIWNNMRWGIYYRNSYKYFSKYNHIVQLHRFDFAYIFFKKRFNITSSIIENAAEDSFFEGSSTHTDNRYAICVANYMPRKNQEFVLKAFYQADIDPDFELIFIGSDANDYYKQLNRMNDELSKKYGEKRIRFLYGVSREKTIEYVKNAYLCLLGSTWEAFPITIVETMAAGVPFISTEVGIVKYLPGGVIIHSVEEMAYWISTFVSNKQIAHNLGLVGNIYAKHNLSISAKVEQLSLLLEN